jgi:hypothetical protein
MQNPREPLNQAETDKIARGRDSSRPIQEVRFTHREIPIAVNLTQVINPNPGIIIADLVFIDCVFLFTVDLSDMVRAGRVTFQDCTFNAKVSIAAMANITLGPGNNFLSDLTINNTLGTSAIENFSVEGKLEIEAMGPEFHLRNINSEIKKTRFKDYLTRTPSASVELFFQENLHLFRHTT